MLIAALALSAFAVSPASQTSVEFEVGGYRATLNVPVLEEARESIDPDAEVRGTWWGKQGAHDVRIVFQVMDGSFVEPGDVTEMVVDYLAREGEFTPTAQSFPKGDFGYAPYASLVRGDIRAEDRTDAAGVRMILGGVLKEGAWVVEVSSTPAPSAEDEAVLRGFLEEGVKFVGDQRDPEWTTEELLARWKRDVPERLHGDFEKNLARKGTIKKSIIRTKNYVVLTNASGGNSFARQMEKNYAIIKKIFPFEDVEGQRLMPVFLFRENEDYFDFCVKIADVPKAQAKRSKGHAWRDYYATWYESPKDPVHIHESTHQIFKSRLRLNGGGSWFQEGVAEYVETSDNDRNEVANLVKKGRHKTLREFFALKSLLYSSAEKRKSGGSEAGDMYKQAALLIEFLRESKFGKKKFPEFMRTVGKVRRNDVPAIEEALRFHYDVSIEELDELFQKYCDKR